MPLTDPTAFRYAECMEITVRSISTLDGKSNAGCDKLPVILDIDDEAEDYSITAEVHLWVEKRDAPLSELKREAIERALAFFAAAARKGAEKNPPRGRAKGAGGR